MNIANIFEIQPTADYTVIRFYGFIDASTVQQIRPALQRQLPDYSANLIVDMREVGFLDSHGIGLFVSLLKQAHKNKGRMAFANTKGQPASVLKMVGFNGGLVSYCPTLNDALALFAKNEAVV
ncbi:MAG: STAS domain-containing protein [Bdellovibrionales bacterium]|jgi:anti-anti-sigma factor|nr:STAS domain-containing protein [Bdellovibrionales bacterium]